MDDEEIVETEDTETQEDSFEDLEDDVRQRVEARIAKAEEKAQQQLSQVRQNLGTYGYDLNEDSGLTIRDPSRVQQHLAPLFPQPQAAPQPQRTEEEIEDEWVMPDLDPQGFQRKLDKLVAKATGPLQAALQEQRAYTAAIQADSAALRVKDALQQYQPRFAFVTDHPEFHNEFRKQLQGIDPKLWQNSEQLVGAAMLVAGHLDWSKVEEKPTTPTPTRNVREQAQAAANRAGLTQLSPSRGTTRAGRNEDDYTEDERHLAQISGMTPEMWRSLSYDRNLAEHEDQYERYRNVKNKERSGGRR